MARLFTIPDEHRGMEDNKVHGFAASHWGSDMVGAPANLYASVKNVSEHAVIRVAKFFLFLGGILCILRAGYVQIIMHEEHSELAIRNRFRVVRVMPARGKILDRNGITVVDNEPLYTVMMESESKSVSIETINMLARILELPAEDILSRLDGKPLSGTSQKIIAESVAREAVVAIKLSLDDLPGVEVVTGNKRVYPFGPAVAHVAGVMGALNEEDWKRVSGGEGDYAPGDRIGKTGLEQEYELLLRGSVGKTYVETDASGEKLGIPLREDPRQGANLSTELDINLQKFAYERLLAIAQRFPRSVAVVLDPRSGAVLALVSVPSFDSNIFSERVDPASYQLLVEDENRPLFNRSISGEYPSGSTIKPVIALAGLDQGIVNAHTTIMSTGGIRVDRWFFPDWKAGGHGATNVVKALAESVNTYFYVIGGGYNDTPGLGIDEIGKYLHMFGIGESLGIDMPNEQDGFVPTKEWKEKTKGEQWYIGDTYHAAIGQGDVLVTPLQVAAFTMAVANGGTLYRPHLAFTDGKDPEIHRKINIAPSFFKTIQEGMRAVVTIGSAQVLADVGVPAAGKTGTAQVGGDFEPHAWFTGYAPSDNPEIVVTVLVENAGEGSAIAAPVARDIMRWYFDQIKEQ